MCDTSSTYTPSANSSLETILTEFLPLPVATAVLESTAILNDVAVELTSFIVFAAARLT